MMKFEGQVPPHPRRPVNDSWMVIFADLLALLLTFFVLMYSMNSVQVSKWKAVVDSLSEHLNPERAKIQEKDWEKVETALIKQKQALSLHYLKNIIEEKLQYDPVLRRSSVQLLGDRLAISLPADLIFEKGSSSMTKEAYAAMMELGASLRHIRNRITVVGHTDLEPTSGLQYPSNWELSLVRAISVANMIRTSGYREKIETFGNGSSRFRDMDESIPLNKRYLLARRVDVIIRQDDRDGL